MRPKFLYAIILVVAFGCNSSGQQKLKTVDKNQTLSPSSSKTGATEIIQKVTTKNYPDLKPGDVAPDAVKIDADFIQFMMNGNCIIYKGGIQAMVDLKGNFIVPWGKYKIIITSGFPFTTLILVEDPKTNKQGFINSKGEVVVPLIYDGANCYNAYKMASVSMLAGQMHHDHVWLDTKGNQISYLPYKTANSVSSSFGRPLYTEENTIDRIGIVDTKLVKLRPNLLATTYISSTGFATRNGKLAIQSSYVDAGDFSEGLAAVATADQFNVERWGYIDPYGKLIIPYTFQKQPGNFHHGLALVEPFGKSDFDFAYINKKGEIKIKVGKGDQHPSVYPSGSNGERVRVDPRTNTFNELGKLEIAGFFVKDYAFWGDSPYTKLLDTAGNFHTLADIVKDPVLHNDAKGLQILNYDDLGIYFYRPGSPSKFGNDIGMVDHDGNSLFPASFITIKPDYYSPYALAEFSTGPNPHRFGIINNQGIFVLVLAEKSKF